MTDPTDVSHDVIDALLGPLNELAEGTAHEDIGGAGVRRVVQLAAATMPGADHAAISLIRGGKRPKTIGATGDLPMQIDQIQYELNEGPCLQALESSGHVTSIDLSRDAQWPRFGPRAAQETGVRSMASFRLVLDANSRGALNFYSTTPGAFNPSSVQIASLLASYTALVLRDELYREKTMHLERALESSRQIGAAMGILMARNLCTFEQAFAMLRDASQHTHRKLRDVALEVLETGALPTWATHPRPADWTMP